MRRLLAISWEMPPMYGPRATQVSRTIDQLVTQGWQSTVVCMAPRRGGPHWPSGVEPKPPASGVTLHRVPSPEEWLAWRALSRVARSIAPWAQLFPDEKWVWIGRAARAAAADARSSRFEGLLTFGQPWSDHLIGLRVARETRLRWVAHFSDPWVDNPYIKGPAWQRRFWRRMERDVIGTAGAVVFVTRQTADVVMAKYPADWRRKVAVVPHGYDLTDMPPAAATPRASRALRLVYTGRFYRGIRTPRVLLEGVQQLADSVALANRLEIVLLGPFVGDYRADAVRLGVERFVTFGERRPAAEAYRDAAAADVLLTIDAPAEGSGMFLPSKVIDYLMFRKPILGVTPVSGATADLLRRLECPIVPPDDPTAMALALGDLLRAHESGTLRVSDSFTRAAEEFDIRRTTAQLSDVLRRAFEPQASRHAAQ